MEPEILYEDKFVIVCVKPEGMPSQDDHSSTMDMVSWLKNHVSGAISGKPPYIGVVHRLDRPVGGIFFRAIEAINAAHQQGTPVVACDISSGIEGNTGAVLGIAVQADETVTFSCAKPGLLQGEGKHCTGRLTVGDIGIPEELLTGCL